MDADSYDDDVVGLYESLLRAWNQRDGDGMAVTFTDDGEMIGFDGSQVTGRSQIASEMNRIFADHETASFVWKVRGVRALGPGLALVRAVAGMVPPGQSDIYTVTGWRICRSRGPFATSLVEEGEAEPHHVLPHTGWVSRRISSADDVNAVIRLFRLNQPGRQYAPHRPREQERRVADRPLPEHARAVPWTSGVEGASH